MSAPRKSPIRALLQGLCAGAIGTAVFTGVQRLTSPDEPETPPKDWGDTPEPAQVGQRVAEGVFHEEVPLERAGELTQVVHWLYGTGWGAVYGVLEESLRRPLLSGVALTSVVVGTDYSLLPAMKLYKPPWEYPAKTLGKDFAVHLVHGLATAAAYRALEPLFSRD